MTSSRKASSLIDWYWNEGWQRQGEYHLSKGIWLDRLYYVAESKQRMETANARHKGALALWGASQTGKSTLLSQYIDAGTDYTGAGSALDWGQPARFSDAGQKPDPNVVVFNPFNLKTDGSACVTRFIVARKEEVNAQHPIEVRIFQPKQLLHALASGFLTECHPEDETQRKQFWNTEDVRTLIRTFPTQAPNEFEQRGAFELLRDVVDVLQSMCEIKDDRYRNLLGDFPDLRRQILESEGLAARRDSVLAFAAKLFWNGWPSITEAFKSILAFRTRLFTMAPPNAGPNLRLWCNLSVARLLVDFSAYSSLLENAPRAESIRRLRCVIGDKGMILTDEPDASGSKLVNRDVDFALLQALACELVVPLREDVLAQKSPLLLQLLEKAHVLDIPGTANEFVAAESELLTDAALAGPKAPQMFTQVLKRGKTSSMVYSSARNYDIDGFTIMAKWGIFPGNQSQLASGVDAWWRSYTGGPMNEAQGKEVPVNFVVTFLGEMISHQLGRTDFSKVGQAFETLFGKMGAITNPALTSSFVTTYPHIPGGRIEHADGEKTVSPEVRQAVYAGLSSRPDFRRQFLDGNWKAPGETESQSLRHAIMSPDGGTDYLLRKLMHDADTSPRLRKVAELERDIESKWEAILKQAVPEEGNDGKKQAMMMEWKVALSNRLDDLQRNPRDESQRDAAQHMSYWLRKFLHVDASHLDPGNLDRVYQQQAFSYDDELYFQFQAWKEYVPDMPLEEVCITDKSHAMRLRWYLAEKVMEEDLLDLQYSPVGAPEGFCRLLRDRFGNMDSRAIQNALPFLALRLSRAIAGLPMAPAPHQGISEQTLSDLYQATRQVQRTVFDYQTSPHYIGMVAPFLEFLDQVALVPATARGRQPGDESLLGLLGNSN